MGTFIFQMSLFFFSKKTQVIITINLTLIEISEISIVHYLLFFNGILLHFLIPFIKLQNL